MSRWIRWKWLPALLPMLAAGVGGRTYSDERSDAQDSSATSASQFVVHEFVSLNCLDCHDDATKTAGLSLEAVIGERVDQRPEIWEQVVRRLQARQMPPREVPRPEEDHYNKAIRSLENLLDAAAAKHPNPGRTDALRRLSRVEYQNAIRDLLALEIDVDALLPADEASHGFDNVASGAISPALLSRYVSAAQKISRLAIGRTEKSPGIHTVRIRPDLTQEEQMPGLPLGTRGGALIRYTFPRSGQYEIQVRLMRDRNEHVEGLSNLHELEVLVDRERVKLFTVEPPDDENGHATADAHLTARLAVGAGPHQVGVTFLKPPSSLVETKRQPYAAHFNMHRHPRLTPAIYQFTITGPLDAKGLSDSPSRRKIFADYPQSAEEEDDCARRILTALMQRAYRRPVDDEDLENPRRLYQEARRQSGFEAGIEAALGAVLVSPHFLFRVERDPPGVLPKTAYKISDLELASRLSFFLWSSIPDDELLDLASRETLHEPDVLEAQVRRMLADERSRSITTNFADQWLHLRNLEAASPDARLFPDFDDNLRQAFRQETQLFVESVLREDRSLLDLITADYTFLNERLAKHYGIPHVYGSRFRRVALEDGRRGGLLRHGSILTVTSYATRTSPVIRGNWILKNFLDMAPPPPPPNVPVLTENTVKTSLPIRERLAQHRADASCARCHDLMDPVGFALENYDAVGRWRNFDAGQPVDAAGGFPDGSEFSGIEGLEQGLVKRPELFVSALTGRLLTYALGRPMEYYDAPAIRKIVREAQADDYRFSSLIQGIVESVPFRMRTTP
jgi:hypothetical protein